jgi:hypothetical protein
MLSGIVEIYDTIGTQKLKSIRQRRTTILGILGIFVYFLQYVPAQILIILNFF